MTREEIKSVYSMRDILARYGMQPNRAGFVPCPFHQEDTASMKIYERDFHCFGCGENGDIFTFVQRMEDVDFRKAFEILGGSREPTFEAYVKIEREKLRGKKRQEAADRRKYEFMVICRLITAYRGIMQEEEPLSDLWCYCMNKLQYQIYLLENHEKG